LIITYQEFKNKLRELEITQKKFAEIIGYDSSSIRKWAKKDNIPKFAEIILKYIECLKCLNKFDF